MSDPMKAKGIIVVEDWIDESVLGAWRFLAWDDLVALTREGVESGTIRGEVVEDECPWCAGDGCWEESNPLPGYSPGPAPMTCPYCKGVGRVLVIPLSTEGET